MLMLLGSAQGTSKRKGQEGDDACTSSTRGARLSRTVVVLCSTTIHVMCDEM
jgi:hypothetical protein